MNEYDFLKVNKILELTIMEDELNNVEDILNKLIEEMLELSLELVKKDEEGIAEELYDVFNTSISLLYILEGEEKINFLFNNDSKSNFIILDLKELINETRLLNSFFHIDTKFQSKTGIKTKNKLNEKIETIINSVRIFIKMNVKIRNKVKIIMDKKLNKWENKLLVFQKTNI
jgi:hypothetical protein